jgi:hypothetical protein
MGSPIVAMDDLDHQLSLWMTWSTNGALWLPLENPIDAPAWDDRRGSYVQWDRDLACWMQWETNSWKAIDFSFGQPVWNEERNTYILRDAKTGTAMAWDNQTANWVAFDPSE